MSRYNYYIGVPSSIMTDKRLSTSAKGVGAGIYNLAKHMISNPETANRPITVEDFLFHYGGAIDDIFNAFQELRKNGYVELNNLCEITELHVEPRGVNNEDQTN